jgi:serine/tyrosine/threonine adenylyltransferase
MTQVSGPIDFNNSYARLPDRFYARFNPTPVARPRLIKLNETLALELGLDPAVLASQEVVEALAGNRVLAGSEPLAMAYAGHQFGGFSPQLGDGRAILLGEVIGRSGQRRDIQLKGSGPTPFSRRGDGRAALGPVLREYIISEAMAAFGIPTTRSLAAVATGETVWRETPLPGAVLTRVAASHIRVGTFQYFAARGDAEAIRCLADHVIARHYPEADGTGNRYRALLDAVIGRQADLVAQWLLVGFIHGVMNTDNMSVAGETIDYGPCAFLDDYDPAKVFSSIDQMGRYAYENQPGIAQWNLARFAETLLPLLADEQAAAVALAEDMIEGFSPRFGTAYTAGLSRKLGLLEARADDTELVQALLAVMAQSGADFTLTFSGLADAARRAGGSLADVRQQFRDPAAFDAWAARWQKRLSDETQPAEARHAIMRAANPMIIPRNHLVEEAIAAAVESGDFAPFEELVAVVAAPYREHAVRFRTPPRPEQVVRATFCGT